ncbi:MAG: hypothetical protein WC784_01220 [Candidatus Shapirobacteria bacterium]|jgi:hypothetical protein
MSLGGKEQTIQNNLNRLVDSRIKTLDYPRKSSILRLSAELKTNGQTVFPFPSFDSNSGRVLTYPWQTNDILTYSRMDSLNALMAYAGNNETGELLKGALIDDIKSDSKLTILIKKLVGKLEKMAPIISIEDPHLFLNQPTRLKLVVPKKYTSKVVDLPLDPQSEFQPLSQGFIVPIEVAKNLVGQIIKQLSEEKWINQFTGEVVNLKTGGLVGSFYDQSDASYLAKMLKNFIN